ncbi:hypothetical protein KIN20_001366 [Parelaphostrongylus tenuis]|uniref:Uncharacterized protein n=1 Tax=Parelaphostrongylus tenuis TaxID=148309 RepID=A0AAD5MEV2_PARTN|nr:hypothetical protein KIN20_001366 [Parelaphostrongylus tenuis]
MTWQADCCVTSVVRNATADSPYSLGRGHKTAKPEGLMPFFGQLDFDIFSEKSVKLDPLLIFEASDIEKQTATESVTL